MLKDKKVRILLADDHAILRYGLSTYLAAMDDIQIVGEAADGHECMQLYSETMPDVCILDIGMPRKNGIEVTRAIRQKDGKTKLIILSMYGDEQTVNKARQAGANAYIVKSTPKEVIANAVRKTIHGEEVIIDDPENEMMPPKTNHADLTNREQEILELVVEGYSSPQIADKLFISRRTVETHRNNMMQKLELKNTASLVRYALQHRLVETAGHRDFY